MENDDKLITLKEMIRLHDAGRVMYTRPSRWDVFDIPSELLTAWWRYVDEKDQYDKILKKYGVYK